MLSQPNSTPAGQDKAPHTMVWLASALFLSYLSVAMSMPTTSIYVDTALHLGNAMAGLAVGVAFASTILTRSLAGRFADHHGGKPCMLWGLGLYAAGAIISALAAWHAAPLLAFGVLTLGRLVLGLGESLTIVGVLAWGIGIMGHQRSGRVFALVGMGMYGAFAAGSPLGLTVYDHAGYLGVSLACLLVPLLGLVMAAPIAPVPPQSGEHPPLRQIIAKIWDLGLVVFLQGIGFAALGAFMPLLFLHRHWPHASLGLTFFGTAFVLVRLFCGHLPDRIGGVRVAVVSLAVETCGQLLLYSATTPTVALIGAALTGAGCSMIFPAMGVEVVRRVPPHLRGTAMGGFAAFQDLAYGATGPLTGLLADRAGDAAVFLAGSLTSALGLSVAIILTYRARRPAGATSQAKETS
ncbi:arabinose transporter [Acetobacter garciniae]